MQLKLRVRALALLLCLFAAAVAVRAAPQPHQAAEERSRSGASCAPAAALHHLLLARDAAANGRKAEAVRDYRIAADLAPDLFGAHIGLAAQGFPGDLRLVYEGLSGGVRAVGRSWELQRRLAAAVLPTFWMAMVLAATVLVAGVGLRHLPKKRHILVEAFRQLPGPRVAAAIATLLCLLPLGLPWGLAAAAAGYVALVQADLVRQERRMVIFALATLLLVPGLWKSSSSWFAPLDTNGVSWLIERAQKELPTPELEGSVENAFRLNPSPEFAFAEGMLHRRNRRFAEAKASFTKALEANTSVASHARINLGNLRFWDGDTPGAAQFYEQVLDEPQARLEARYNLALALSRLYRFEEADERLDEASSLDFDRVRTAFRSGAGAFNGDLMDGMLSPRELWRIDRSAREDAISIPPLLTWFLPKSGFASAPLAILAGLLIGGVTGALLSRRFRVHECQHCGTPVCRRCVMRTGGHAYCSRCASTLGSLPRAAYNRVLLRRLLGKELVRSERIRAWITILSPGLGPILRGRPLTGYVTSWLVAFGLLFATRAAWAFPTSSVIQGLEEPLRILGLAIALAAWARSFVVARRARPHRYVRSHFETEIYRLAA